ncbi:MAG: hypothetical protein V7K25_27360 [Nostoc sp.]|uniref:hypothetical protein n=1 Tax=Nostoc sp. TaxID=1180 RepID=UPI002FF527B1
MIHPCSFLGIAITNIIGNILAVGTITAMPAAGCAYANQRRNCDAFLTLPTPH